MQIPLMAVGGNSSFVVICVVTNRSLRFSCVGSGRRIFYVRKQNERGFSMKALGAIRKIDGLGRITLPKSVRDKFDLPDRTAIEIYTNDEGIVLRKYIGGCIFCDEAKNVRIFEGKKICASCYAKLQRQ